MLNSNLIESGLVFKCILATFLMLSSGVEAAQGFVNLPKEGFANSAYTLCNTTGEFGLKESSAPDSDANNTCAITGKKLLESPMNAPLEGFNMVGMMARDIPMPAPYAGTDEIVATLTDTIWRNKEKTECIYGTHILLKPAPLADGKMWQVNDIARGGFAGKPVEVAYFFKPEPNKDYGLPEAIFRVGRTFTSVKHAKGDLDLPALKAAPASNKAITNNQAAAVSDNWVNFTTDISAQDVDGTTRKMSSMLYIKSPCTAQDPVEQENAIRFRTTGQNGEHQLEITVPGLVPVGAVVEKY